MKIAPFALERWMTRWETRVEFDIAESGILPLSVNDLLDFLPAGERAATLARLLDTRLGYSEACGSEELRGILAATYADTGPDGILVTTGAIEANFLLLNTLLDAGDHVVAVYPAYQQLYEVPRAIGCEVDLWQVRERPGGGFAYDLSDLDDLLRPDTKLLIVNTPHNPTGAMLSAADLQHLYDLMAARGGWLMCDEAYRWLQVPDGESLPTPARDLGPHAISVGTISKPFGLPGLRIGWLAAPEEIVAACWGMRDYITLSPGKLNDALAVLAFQHRERLLARNAELIQANLDTARAWFAEHADIVEWQEPRAGLLALLRYRLDVPSLELADRLAGEYSVMLAPGSAFGFEYHLRIGVGQDPAIFAEGLARTAACLHDLRASGVGLRP